MTSSQVPASSRSAWLRRRPGRTAAAGIAALAVATLASCSSAGKPSSSPSPSPSISVAAQVPAAPKACTVSANLVNSCRPWLGAVVADNPGAPINNRIAQFFYLERLLDHHIDIFRDYDTPPGSGVLGTIPLNSNERYFVKQPNTYVDVNWKPTSKWAQADGGDASVNAYIAKAADNIKAVAPHKIFLTLWWEPQNDVSGGTTCPGATGSAGTPAQYRGMWQNVEKIFREQGATNVVWAMDYMSDPNYDCMVPQLWPGNNLVDWVLYDSYDHDNKLGKNWTGTVGRFYQTLQQDSSPSVDFDAKPWGLGEYGVCRNKSQTNSLQYFEQAKQSIDNNAYPNLKMYIMFATAASNHPGKACLPDYNYQGQLDAAKNSVIKAFVNSPVFNK
jgi:hypothetical protein